MRTGATALKAVQKFPDEYLQRCREMSHDDIARFLDDFRRIHANKHSRSRLISMKVPVDLLEAFKTKSSLAGLRYQTQIKELMKSWVLLGPLDS